MTTSASKITTSGATRRKSNLAPSWRRTCLLLQHVEHVALAVPSGVLLPCDPLERLPVHAQARLPVAKPDHLSECMAWFQLDRARPRLRGAAAVGLTHEHARSELPRASHPQPR